nr:hypothetical protein [Lysobacter enzymogenes]
MDARRESLPDPAGLRALLSPSVIVSLALALTAAVLALVYLFQMRAPAARAAPRAPRPPRRCAGRRSRGAAGAGARTGRVPLRRRSARAQASSSYTGDGRC